MTGLGAMRYSGGMIRLCWACMLVVASIGVPVALVGCDRDEPAEPAPAATQQHLERRHAAALDHLDKGNFRAAIEMARQTLEDFPDDAVSHSIIARALMAMGEFEQAYEHARRSLAIDDAQPQMHLLVGRLAQRYATHAEALAHYQRAMHLDRADHRYPQSIAAVALAMGELDVAEQHARRSIELESTQSQGYGILAEVAARRGQIDRADELMEQAIANADDRSHAEKYLVMRVRILREGGEATAGRALRLVGGLEPDELISRPALLRELARTMQALGQHEQAAMTWGLRARRYGDACAAAEAAAAYHAGGYDQQARQWLDEARKLQAWDPRVQEVAEMIDGGS